MAHFAKMTAAGCGGVSDHHERKKRENGEHRKYGNQDIDLSRTELNYNLGPDREIGQREFIKQRCSEVKCLKRDNVKVMCSWVITAPKDLLESEQRKFFEESYKFLNERYSHGSERNVISSYVHMDETTPHMHYAFVPVVTDKKKGHEKVSAHELVTRNDLRTFHADLERHMSDVFGREIGIQNEATREGNRAIEELKRGTAQERLENLEKDVAKLEALKTETADMVSSLRNLELELKTSVEHLRGEEKSVKGSLRALEGQIKQTSSTLEKINAIKPEKGLMGTVKGENVTVENIEWLKKAALPSAEAYDRAEKYRRQGAELLEKNKTLAEENADLKGRMPSWLENAQALQFSKLSERQKKELLELAGAKESKNPVKSKDFGKNDRG